MASAAPLAWALQHTERHLLCRREYGWLGVWASRCRERHLAVLVFALLARYMWLQHVVIGMGPCVGVLDGLWGRVTMWRCGTSSSGEP